jgi:hypothetical protein
MTDDPWRAQVAHLNQAFDCLETRVARRTGNLEACTGELTARYDRLDARVVHWPSTWLVVVACIALGRRFVGLQPFRTRAWRWTTWGR